MSHLCHPHFLAQPRRFGTAPAGPGLLPGGKQFIAVQPGGDKMKT